MGTVQVGFVGQLQAQQGVAQDLPRVLLDQAGVAVRVDGDERDPEEPVGLDGLRYQGHGVEEVEREVDVGRFGLGWREGVRCCEGERDGRRTREASVPLNLSMVLPDVAIDC